MYILHIGEGTRPNYLYGRLFNSDSCDLRTQLVSHTYNNLNLQYIVGIWYVVLYMWSMHIRNVIKLFMS